MTYLRYYAAISIKIYQTRHTVYAERKDIIMGICDTISEKVQGGRAKEVVALINQALEEGIAPDTILT